MSALRMPPRLDSTPSATLLMTGGLVFYPAGRQQGPHQLLWNCPLT